MNIINKSATYSFLAALFFSMFTGNAAAALNLAQSPLSLADQVASNVMVMLDNSGSMTDKMYKSGFDSSTSYGGMFTDGETYEYDPEIPVNAAAYPYMLDGAATPATVIDTDAKGAFVKKSCTPGGGANCWSGNFLNWLTTRRIDASRDVLVGGKLESRTAYNYSTSTNSDLGTAYKKVANNEPSDRDETGSSSISYNHSPIPNNLTATITSPAKGGNFKNIYDPYAKLSIPGGLIGANYIYDKNDTIIGEFGEITQLDQNWKTVTLSRTYSDPIVIAAPLTHNGGDASVARIQAVAFNSFQVKVQEWNYLDGNHGTKETLSYFVIEKGNWELSGNVKIKANKIATSKENVSGNSCGYSENESETVNFNNAFSNTPVVISSIMTYNGSDTVNSRVWNIQTGNFNVALQEEEDEGTHASETIGWVAIEKGEVNYSSGSNKFLLEAGSENNVNQNNKTITFTANFSGKPSFLAAAQTKNNNDPFALRLNSASKTDASLFIEEEASCDSEVNSADETVGYLALEGNLSEINLALIVKDVEPTGVLHDVIDDVRMGISFYRYNPNSSNIYEGSEIQGGTLRFNIPKNPFVKKPSETNTTNLPTPQQGYRILEGYIGTPIDTIVDAVERYPSIWGTTPIAENLWEVIQYYEQDSPYYDSIEPLSPSFPDYVLANDSSIADKSRDPFYVPAYDKKVQCVNSNVLIVTDGEPFRDAAIPSFLVDYDTDSASDELSDLVDGNARGHGNLDDVAYWAFCDTSGGATCKTAGKATVRVGTTIRPNLRDLRTDPGMEGNQFLRIDTIGFAGNSIRQILQDTADNAGGKAYAAEGPAQLKAALTSSFGDSSKTASVAAIAANSTFLNSSSKIFQASFESGTWSGKLKAFDLNSIDASVITSPVAWNTDSVGTFPADVDTRKIFSYAPPATPTPSPSGSPVQFKTITDLNASHQALLTQDQIYYLRGDDTNEVANGGTFRNRSTLLGDITNSNPAFVGKDNFGYASSSSSLSAAEKNSYRAFQSGKSSRSDTVYVGANDGMLHAFDAGTGVEKFAYVPATVIPNLSKLTDPEYGESIAHQYFVDGSPRTGDVYYGGAWHTVLAGTTGAGGRGVFALDITNPDSFASSNVLWEFNNDNDADMGYTMAEPSIVRLANGKWGVVIGNGYNSDSDKAVLFILDIEDGSVIAKIDTAAGSAGTPNGLSTPVVIDIDGDRVADTVYAGDLLGNMWKFDISDNAPSNWETAFTIPAITAPPASVAPAKPVPLFVATDGTNPQPITAKPLVGKHPDGGVLVYFGTGKYIEVGDNVIGASPQVQSFYGLRDNFANGDATPITARSELEEQTIDIEQSDSFDTDNDGIDDETLELRVTSQNPVNYTDSSDPSGNPIRNGWYMDLISPNAGAEGERVIFPSILNGSRILFSTLIPDADPCEFGGTGWFMVLDAATGARSDRTTFDLTNDGVYDDTDNTTVAGATTVVSGKRTPGPLGGMVSSGDTLHVYNNDSGDGDGIKTDETGVSLDDALGRQSWRQLR